MVDVTEGSCEAPFDAAANPASPDKTAQAKAMADPSPESSGASQPRNAAAFAEATSFGFDESEIAMFELGIQKGNGDGSSLNAALAG